jgi:branched-subunit amino acid ABC-type transport system permease component
MRDLLPFIVGGIALGSIYGMGASGLVLTYKTTGVFNFGYGAIATAAAYVFYWLEVTERVPWPLAFIVAVLGVGTAIGLLLEPMNRALATRSVADKIVATIGIVLVVEGLATIKYGYTGLSVAQYLPDGAHTFRVGGVYIQYLQVVLFGTGLLALVLLEVLLGRLRVGVAMRAVVDSSDLLAMLGTSPSRVRRAASVIGSLFAALSGVLLLPLIGLDAQSLILLVVSTFGAAAIGAFSNIPLAYGGAILIGIVADVAQKYVISVTWLSGVPNSAPFIILLLALIIIPGRKLVNTASVTGTVATRYRQPAAVQGVVALVTLSALAIVPYFAGTRLGYFTVALTQIILVLSLGLLVRTSGHVSLCHCVSAPSPQSAR